jgi:hypothetical protein
MGPCATAASVARTEISVRMFFIFKSPKRLVECGARGPRSRQRFLDAVDTPSSRWTIEDEHDGSSRGPAGHAPVTGMA